MKLSELSPLEIKRIQAEAKKSNTATVTDQPLEAIDRCLDCQDYEECTDPAKTIRQK